MQKFTCLIICLFSFQVLCWSQRQAFIENKGQWVQPFDYKLDMSNGAVFFRPNSIVVHLVNKEDLRKRHEVIHNQAISGDLQMHHHAYTVAFVNADTESVAQPSLQKKEYYNYFIGNDQNRWKGHVHLYGQVYYPEIYPGVDLRYYFSPEGNLKYDLIIHPGADISQVKLHYSGLDDILLQEGHLLLKTSVGDIVESAPYAYQQNKNGKTGIRCNYKLDRGKVAFDLGRYNKKEDLIIDPELVFSTFSGSSANNFGFTATYSADGGLYTGSIVFQDAGSYPVTSGAYHVAPGGGNIDIAITKFSADGANLDYSTFLGGHYDEIPYSLYETKNQSLIVLGSTGSDNFPVSNNAYSKFMWGGNVASFFNNEINFPLGSDMFVSVLDSAGANLKASTFFGGSSNDGFNSYLEYNYGDEFRGEVVADDSSNIFIAFSTLSVNMPTDTNSYIQAKKGKQEGFVASFDESLTNLRWATYIGGSEDDNALSLKRGMDNKLYVAGGTKSSSMDDFTNSAYHQNNSGNTDGYLICLNENKGTFLYGTFNGSASRDVNYFVDIDNLGDVYVFGQTHGLYPTSSDAYKNPGSAQFLQKFSPDLSQSLRSTVFGDSTHIKCNISPTAFMVDECRNIYISGWGGNVNTLQYNQGHTLHMPLTVNALQRNTDGSDFYFLVLDATWKKLNYATYFGGSNADHVDGGTSRFAPDGTIYQAACAGCFGNSFFPTTVGAYSRNNGSSNGCNVAAIKINFEALKVIASVKADKDSSCVPYVANITNLSYNADYYVWILPDGTKDTTDLKSIMVPTKGDHTYKLIAIDTTCGFRDTTQLTLHGFKNEVHAAFMADYDSCSNDFKVHCINKSSDANQYLWKFGDGKTSKLKDPVHGYVHEGHYDITLISKNSYCDLKDSVTTSVNFKKRISRKDFYIYYAPCTDGTSASFKAIGTGFQNYQWNFSDGNSGRGISIDHDFKKGGTYRVELILQDTLCNRFLHSDTSVTIFNSGYTPKMPNVFTPNNDDHNDYFGLPADLPQSYIHGFSMKIYNRWGTLMYETSEAEKPWDGRFEDSYVPDGVYFYIINLKDDCDHMMEYKGSLHIIKS